MRLFDRSCSSCGEKLQPRVASVATGRCNEWEVELRNLPYRACSCGKKAKWAFDPGTAFSEQLFSNGIRFAGKPLLRSPRCARCESELDEMMPVELTSEARLEGFEPIALVVRGPGFRCPSCSLEQVDEGSFVKYADGMTAVFEATRSLGLKSG